MKVAEWQQEQADAIKRFLLLILLPDKEACQATGDASSSVRRQKPDWDKNLGQTFI